MTMEMAVGKFCSSSHRQQIEISLDMAKAAREHSEQSLDPTLRKVYGDLSRHWTLLAAAIATETHALTRVPA